MLRWRRNTGIVLTWFVTTLSMAAQPLITVTVQDDAQGTMIAIDGVVEAVRASGVATQVSGVLTEMHVKPGQQVTANQVLARIDARAAGAQAAAGQAQAKAAQAMLEAEQKSYERQQKLFQKQYLSPAAMEQAEAQFKSARAQAQAQMASANAMHTQAGFYILRAPYAGQVAHVPAQLGDTVMPGQPIVQLFDPKVLRVTAMLPQKVVSQLRLDQTVKIEFPSLPSSQRSVVATSFHILPTVDAITQTVEMRLTLPSTSNVAPGTFVRVWLMQTAQKQGHFFIPAQTVFTRGELQLVYVVNRVGQPLLRQIKTGALNNNQIEVLSGLRAGERVALDPLAAGRLAAP